MLKQKKSFLSKIAGKEEKENEIEEISSSGEKLNKKMEQDETEEEGQLTIDVYHTPTEIVISSIIGGTRPENIDISVTNNVVTIKGKREKREEVNTNDYFYQECFWGTFSRSVVLPEDVDADKVSAEMKDGILTIRLPKLKKTKTKKVRIKNL